MKTLGFSRITIYLLHVLFWVCYGAILYASLSVWHHSPAAVWHAVLTDVGTSSAIAYLNLLVFLPNLYSKGRYIVYVFASLLLVALVVFLRVNVLNALSHNSLVYTYFIRAVPALGFYLITTVIWFFSNMISAQRRETELRNNQLDTELKFLKLQLSPHFLFNTLNNIYSLAYFSDKNTAPAILKLSGMMRHMLLDDRGEFILLSKEITFMENFIELWRLKLDDKPTIQFNHSGVEQRHRIAHLIFLVFLENAFKHGNTINGFIEVNLTIDKEDMLHFHLKNDVLDAPNTLEEKSGVGLLNVRKRLELLYPDKHFLTLDESSRLFEIHLTIDLK